MVAGRAEVVVEQVVSSERDLDSAVRGRLRGTVTGRSVEAVELALPPSLQGREVVEVGSWEQLDGVMWLVVGIYEPVRPQAPWLVAHARRTASGVVLRHPLRRVEQDVVVRVHDLFPARPGVREGVPHDRPPG